MLRFPCLVLDHDDTVVQSEATVNYPCFCDFLAAKRPGMRFSLADYVSDCSQMSFVDMCKSRFQFTDAELNEEYLFWKQYARVHIPEAFAGISNVLNSYRLAGGKIFVVSMSSKESILRDYRMHFNFEPDAIFGCDLPQQMCKPNPYPLEQIMTKYKFASHEMLVVDDMKSAVSMARSVGCPIAFAGWGRKDYPAICKEMEDLCDYSLSSVADFHNLLFG